MSESQAIALLADPNKIDLPKKEDTQEEMPVFSQTSTTPSAPTPTPEKKESSSKTSVIDLMDETREKPKVEKEETPKPKENVLDLSDIQIHNDTPKPAPELTLDQIREKKERILYDMERLRRRGIRFPRTFTMASDLQEMEAEYNRIKKDLETEQAVRFQRKMLMTCVSGIEMLNNRFDPFDIQLDGWSESVNENVGDYDDVFEELYEKYRGQGKMAPELRLLFMLGGSALMFHMTKSMFSSASPQVADILRQNPNIASQMQQAAAQQMGGGGGGLASMMGLAMGGNSGIQSNASAAPPNSAGAPPPRGVVIPPPDNVDDVLADLQGSSSRKSGNSRGRGRTGSKRSGGSGSSSGGVDSISFSLNH